MTGITVTAAGCNVDGGEPSTSATESVMATDGATTDGVSDGETTGSVSAGVTTGPATGTATGATSEPAVNYCHGFQASAEEPFLSMYILGGEMLEDGVHWPIECGGQGLWMFGLYPALGGWDPMNEGLTFTVEVDVEGHNNNPAGHFFSGEVGYYIGCEDVLGGVLGVAPVFPPDDLADLAVLDGLPAQVRVTLVAGDQELMVEAAVTLSAPSDLVLQGCEFG